MRNIFCGITAGVAYRRNCNFACKNAKRVFLKNFLLDRHPNNFLLDRNLMHKQNPVFIIFVSSRVVCKFWKTSAKKPGLQFMAAAQDHMVARHGR